MNNAKSLLIDAVESIQIETDKILGEWIHRYCDDEHGNIIHDYADARDIAKRHGESYTVERYDTLITQQNAIQNVLDNEF